MIRASSVVALLLLLSACTPAPTPLAHTLDSSRALAGAVLAAVTSGDQATLDGLALSEQEFRDHVWPALPAARPERNLPFSYVWGDLRLKSQAGLVRILGQYRGQRLTLVDVRFGDVTRYDGYVVHRDSIFTVRTSDGATEDVRLCGAMIEQAGRWKVFSYVADD